MRRLIPKAKARVGHSTLSPYDVPATASASVAHSQLETAQASTQSSLSAAGAYPSEGAPGRYRGTNTITVLPRIVGEPGELTRLIESLNSANPPDYVSAVREVCIRTAASDAHAREASVALFNQISCGASVSRLRAIRLWALMLRYCYSEKFIHKTSRKDFQAAVKEICLNPDTNQALRSRTLEVVAGARFAYPLNTGFKGLWQRVGDGNDSVEGIRFNNPLFFLPNMQSKFDAGLTADPEGHVAVMQRLVLSCEIAHERARMMNELLAMGAVHQTEDVVKDLLTKCVASRSFIQSQLPWATVNAERSTERFEDPDGPERKGDQTFEEQLLGMLLHANEELNDALIWCSEATTPASEPEPGPSGTRRASHSSHEQPSAGPSHATSASPRSTDTSFTGSSSQEPFPVPVSLATPSGAARASPSSALTSPTSEEPPPYTLAAAESGKQSEIAPAPLLSTPPGQNDASSRDVDVDVDIGHALPKNILAYLENRRLSRDVLYDVELALEGTSTRDWLAALADIAQLSATDCKAIALLKRRTMAGE